LSVWLERRSEMFNNPGRGFNSTGHDSQFQRDRARIIHSASFRSLQSKTQVLGLGESDFYRTRLTHSLEVAQVGSGICEWLRDQSENSAHIDLIPSFSLIEAVCLAHDIGHSPFGHGGEVAMNTMMKDYGGFEANGQTLRILARLGEYSPNCGLDLTRRTMLGTIKYPAVYSDVCNYIPVESENPLNIDHWSPPKCIYDAELDVLEWLIDPFSSGDKEKFLSLDRTRPGHARTQYKTLDTSIMELADDIAYGVHDLEDALALGLVDYGEWDENVVSVLTSLDSNPVNDRMDEFNKLLFSNSAKDRKHAISRLVGYLIRSIRLRTLDEFEAKLLRLQVDMEGMAYKILLLIKDFVMRHVIFKPELQMLQYKGQRVIIRLFEIFAANPNRLLPSAVFQQYEQYGHRAIADCRQAVSQIVKPDIRLNIR